MERLSTRQSNAAVRARRAPLALAAVLGLGLAAALGGQAAAPSPALAAGAGGSDALSWVYQTNQASQGTSVSVTGTGTVTVEPDVARLSFSASARDEGAAAAAEAADKTADAVTAALKAAGVPAEDIQTSGVSVYPDYAWDDAAQTSRITGYTATVSYEVEGVSVDEVGDVLGAAIDAGATQVDTVAYYSSAYDEQYLEALRLALGQASAKAQAIGASLYGAGDGQASAVVESVVESPSSQRYRYADGAAFAVQVEAATDSSASSMSVASSVEPGTIDIEAEVTVTYRLFAE